MAFDSITAETKATILLTTRFGELKGNLKPVSPAKFRLLQRWLDARGLTVGALLTGEHQAAVNAMNSEGVGTPLIASMLERIPKLDRIIDQWAEAGIWVVGEADAEFPDRLQHRLGSSRFPLLFGSGRLDLLNTGGVYIVGSRDSSDSGRLFSRTLSKRCGEEGITVISSDMRGVDREAMSTTDGNVVCVLSDSLEKAVAMKRHRQLLEHGSLSIITPFSPNARFSVANAIRVNRYQYCLADFAVIVETRRTGGVWLGAEENRKENWTPAFVRAEENVPLGNEALLNLGYMSLNQKEILECENIGEYLISRLTSRSNTLEFIAPLGGSLNVSGRMLFDIFCEQLTIFADSVARSPEEIQNHFGIESEQNKAWIALALEERLLEKSRGVDQYQVRSEKRHP
ncbi:MAG: DNA-processing protein DprA [Alphaproteobacteria bacterium]|nr:DNA-processing protein DprA [Alphaproteobacteria bacterium]